MTSKLFLLYYFVFYLFISSKTEEIQCPQGCICDMEQNLRGVFCIGEKLTTIEANIPEKVQLLDFSDNLISKLGNYAFTEQKMHQLVILNMSTNSLNEISLRAFEGLDKLQILDLSDNILQTLPEDVFETNLQLLKLYLAGNKFGYLHAEPFLNSNSLQVLDMSRCVLSHLYPETFSKLPSLTNLDISQNFIIQLNVKIFDNLSKLRSLQLTDNKLHCNEEMTELITYLTKKQIIFKNVCQKVEKFQRLVIQQTPTEKSTLLNWNFDNCDIETVDQTTNDTKCQTIYDSSNWSAILVAVSFVCGILFGISLSCCYLNLIQAMKKRRRFVYRSRMRPRSFRRRNDEFLLTETSYNLGLSTPVLGRVRHNNIIR